MKQPGSLLKRIHEPGVQAGIRIVSGLVLFFYVLTHFINHALGLWSLELMEWAGNYFRVFWRFLPITILLYGALLLHAIFALLNLYKRRSLKMGLREKIQITLGFFIPLFMIVHIMATRMASEVFGINDTYAYVLLSTWVQSPSSGLINVTGLLIVWIHGCIGLYAWLKLKPWFQGTLMAIALVLATAIPVLAITGFVSAGRRIEVLSRSGEWLEVFYENLQSPGDELFIAVTEISTGFRYGFAILLIAILVFRIIRYIRNRRNTQVEIDYMDGPVIRHPIGANLLEISRINDVPHASVCGGKGRCSTCRVRIVQTDTDQAAPDAAELKLLTRVRAGDDVRLACQLVPTGKLKVIRLLPADAAMQNLGTVSSQSSGVEQTVAVLFADIRGFTARSESKLPFDVVYLVNQFSRAMGAAIEEAGGQVDKFLGDGLMALFGVNSSPRDGCHSALKAAASMQDALEELNTRLANDIDEPLKVGIGIHAGSVVLGDMGYGASRGLTAIGDTVNTASRLEAATKDQGVSMCISSRVAELAELEPDPTTIREIILRGKTQKLRIHALDRQHLEKLLEPSPVAALD